MSGHDLALADSDLPHVVDDGRNQTRVPRWWKVVETERLKSDPNFVDGVEEPLLLCGTSRKRRGGEHLAELAPGQDRRTLLHRQPPPDRVASASAWMPRFAGTFRKL